MNFFQKEIKDSLSKLFAEKEKSYKSHAGNFKKEYSRQKKRNTLSFLAENISVFCNPPTSLQSKSWNFYVRIENNLFRIPCVAGKAMEVKIPFEILMCLKDYQKLECFFDGISFDIQVIQVQKGITIRNTFHLASETWSQQEYIHAFSSSFKALSLSNQNTFFAC